MGRKIITYYDRTQFKLWVATYHDAMGNQLGVCGYGPTKKLAIADLVMLNPEI